jgi:hypothetical protein
MTDQPGNRRLAGPGEILPPEAGPTTVAGVPTPAGAAAQAFAGRATAAATPCGPTRPTGRISPTGVRRRLDKAADKGDPKASDLLKQVLTHEVTVHAACLAMGAGASAVLYPGAGNPRSRWLHCPLRASAGVLTFQPSKLGRRSGEQGDYDLPSHPASHH